jgi:type I restriction enzyme S subunit
MMRMSVRREQILPEFMIAFLQTRFARSALVKNAKHAINQSSINQGDVKGVPVYLPPVSQQQAFCDTVEQVLSLEAQEVRASAYAEQTFQSLLAGVFVDGC